MFARTLAAAVLIVTAGCAGLEPVGRNATRGESAPASPAPIPPRPEAAPTRASPAAPAPAPPATPVRPPPTQAPQASAPAPAAASSDDEITVRGAQPERQVPAPDGDPRSILQRMEDVRAWDQCVTSVQAAYEANPTRPQLTTPEEYCSTSLGMADRTAVPANRGR